MLIRILMTEGGQGEGCCLDFEFLHSPNGLYYDTSFQENCCCIHATVWLWDYGMWYM